MEGLEGESDDAGPATSAEWRSFLGRAAIFVLGAALIWLALDGIRLAFPYVAPGDEIVARDKFEKLARSHLFGPGDRIRILAFGNSKTLAGLQPAEFERVSGPGVRVYNLGLPGQNKFLPILRTALAAGNRPNYILLQAPWDPDSHKPTMIERIPNDHDIAQTLFPFRSLPRDGFIFLFDSLQTGPIAEYERAKEEAATALKQRGYYFIRAQSHFPHDQLPPGYRLPTDTPKAVAVRKIVPAGEEYRQLAELSRRFGFRVIFVPAPYREGEFAPPAAGAGKLAAVPDTSNIFVLGPEYLVYSPPDFSDPVHLNPTGSAIYTDDLADLFGKEVLRQANAL